MGTEMFAKPVQLRVKKSETTNSIVNKWISRVGFLETYGYDGVNLTGSCLYLKNGYFLTNAHLFGKEKSIAFVTINSKRYRICDKIVSTGSFDLA